MSLSKKAQISPSTMKHCFMFGPGNVPERAEWTQRRDQSMSSTENLLKISFWQLARKHTLLSAASHQGFVRQACSEPRAFKAPIMQQDSAGQKEQECFRQSCGHTGIIHSSVAL
ncbi:hypothetical protein JOQ06_019875 [Pogonophryne albipinna]|uniref:Uncharacterized protein n=1 Tax=Pogonophryne albipinna TaxID=1090488 RepID=A0AAD6BN48_9TELE|nr:hypothetical protein JOQ06_019875 [Pogonophryne albipinna]